MSNDLSPPDPKRFGLTSFAAILSERDPIVGEDPGAFADFHNGMMLSLAPVTPYEAVIAEHLVAIEWELLQHRLMRDAGLRQQIHATVRAAVVARERARHEAALEADFETVFAGGGDQDNREDPDEFDTAAAEALGDALAARAASPDRAVQTEAYAEIAGLGLTPVAIMSAAYRDPHGPVEAHETRIRDLERRRREVRRDYDALLRARAIEGAALPR